VPCRTSGTRRPRQALPALKREKRRALGSFYHRRRWRPRASTVPCPGRPSLDPHPPRGGAGQGGSQWLGECARATLHQGRADRAKPAGARAREGLGYAYEPFVT
jgi:hypothetical protein